MDLSNKRVLITGADGFIGSHLTEALLDTGCDLRAFVYYNSFNSWGWLDALPDATRRRLDVFAGDIRDPNGVRAACKGIDVVLHLAALIAIPFSYHSPDSYVDTNIRGTLNVLQAARDAEIERVVVTSTSEVYGTPVMCRSTNVTPCRASRPTRPPRSAPTAWPNRSGARSGCRS
jgi:nucleoside-diphosphate-sugar epimerase